jgi:hypothetical protein
MGFVLSCSSLVRLRAERFGETSTKPEGRSRDEDCQPDSVSGSRRTNLTTLGRLGVVRRDFVRLVGCADAGEASEH